MAPYIDTHKIYMKLIGAGFEEAKASAFVECVRIVTRHDVAARGDVNSLSADFDRLRRDLSIHLWAVGAIVIGVMAAFHFLA